jgi:hypothetical protein
MTISERLYLNKEALLSLAALIASQPDSEARVHDDLLQTSVSGCEGVIVVQLQLLDLMIGRECDAVSLDAATRIELIGLMARVVVTVFHADGGKQ